jgi:hypothetical protein
VCSGCTIEGQSQCTPGDRYGRHVDTSMNDDVTARRSERRRLGSRALREGGLATHAPDTEKNEPRLHDAGETVARFDATWLRAGLEVSSRWE